MSKNILHISDLHLEKFIPDEKEVLSRFDEPNYKSKFIKKIKDSSIDIDFVVITGDLANTGTENEYKLVTEFLNTIAQELSVKTSHFFICPGNHDINWVKNKIAFHESISIALKKNEPEPKEEEAYKFQDEKFSLFKDFYDSFHKEDKLTFNPLDSLFRELSIDIDGFEVQFCGINSCFKESHSKLSHYGFIDHSNLENSLNNLNEETLKFALLHHIPVVLNDSQSIKNWDDDIKYLCNLNNVRVFIFGHQHKSMATTIIEGKNEFIEFSVGTLGKSDNDVENTFNILCITNLKEELKIQIEKIPFQYLKHGGEYEWHQLNDKKECKKLAYKPQIDESSFPTEEIINDVIEDYVFPKKIELFSSKLLEIVKNQDLFSSGHFHWNPTTRTLGLIDTYSLLSKRYSSLVAKGALLELFRTHSIDSDYIIGLGQEGNVLGGLLACNQGIPFSFIPYHSRRNDHSKHEWELNLSEVSKITVITDVIHGASSIINILNEKVNVFKDVKLINLISLFYISKEEDFHPDIFKSKDERIKFYTVCDKIKIDKCKYDDTNFKKCSIFCNELEKVHTFYSE